ncbi:L-Aspartase-like protein [Cordyceps fumosorosea ARSEF 2679]|uniref:L-Aspartase-like protein n=1 Tax=Cordyceps fumosorosea (strain ARSEF 2679) TaxID=1081104 RepID=A0A162IEL4_CORFA|nr:L-Aspartase-like protein [Cordyceps fumosorosea ARSEF 2679]OAA56045.1 L-Aspartase-like protein [Cordyceps fumosorosea ARSEF 2679]
MTPVVPIRGSISASGDLSTLSYISGAVEGNPDIFIRTDGLPGGPRILPSNEALAMAKMNPISLQAKEGLGITNGTAASCATACLVVHQANQLAVLVQLLTAMGTEALAGTAANYDEFISSVRPHRGQIEAARNIHKFLVGSKISSDETSSKVGLAQDRYSLRTAPQWIGPQLEDLLLATKQVTVEINSTTDNPLIDVDGGKIFQGGNFQAMAITSAMEKVMTVLQNLGRLMFAQSSEMINHATSRGLPPNLSPDDPGASFLCKGFDISMAAYMSELGYLAHPVSTHVQTAEMANQAVNSMALVAARYALEAIEVASLMAAAYIFVLCQALDLRCMMLEFETTFTKEIVLVAKETLTLPQEQAADLSSKIATVLLQRWTQLCCLAAAERATVAARESLGDLLGLLLPSNPAPDISRLQTFQAAAATTLLSTHERTRSLYFERPGTARFISPASKVVYEYVRRDLAVPFVRGVEDHPTVARDRALGNPSGGKRNGVHGHDAVRPAVEGEGINETHNGLVNNTNGAAGPSRVNGVNGDNEVNGDHEANNVSQDRRTPVTLGTMAGDIYQALRNGDLYGRIMKYCQENAF